MKLPQINLYPENCVLKRGVEKFEISPFFSFPGGASVNPNGFSKKNCIFGGFQTVSGDFFSFTTREFKTSPGPSINTIFQYTTFWRLMKMDLRYYKLPQKIAPNWQSKSKKKYGYEQTLVPFNFVRAHDLVEGDIFIPGYYPNEPPIIPFVFCGVYLLQDGSWRVRVRQWRRNMHRGQSYLLDTADFFEKGSPCIDDLAFPVTVYELVKELEPEEVSPSDLKSSDIYL